MPILVSILQKPDQNDLLLLSVAQELIKELGDNFVGLYNVETWNGCNVRIVVKKKDEETYKRIFEIIKRLEIKCGRPAVIIPDIVEEDEL